VTAIIVRAEEVRPDEPRWWATSYSDAACAIASGDANNLHTDGLDECEDGDKYTHAVVDRPEQPAPPAVDPREEAFWSAAFCTALTGSINYAGKDEDKASDAALQADAALAEWRKRFGRKEGL
jgi:hypothetical protein